MQIDKSDSEKPSAFDADGLFGLVAESAGFIVMTWELPGNRIYLSERWSVLLEGSSNPMLTTSRQFKRLVHPDDRLIN